MNILVGYDGTRISENALQMAREHARAFDARIYILTSMDGKDEKDLHEIERARQNLEKIEKGLTAEKLVCETHLLITGLTPGEDLVAFAMENAIDEVIIGVRRVSKIGKLMFGSTAQYVILKTRCPVLAVK